MTNEHRRLADASRAVGEFEEVEEVDDLELTELDAERIAGGRRPVRKAPAEGIPHPGDQVTRDG